MQGRLKKINQIITEPKMIDKYLKECSFHISRFVAQLGVIMSHDDGDQTEVWETCERSAYDFNIYYSDLEDVPVYFEANIYTYLDAKLAIMSYIKAMAVNQSSTHGYINLKFIFDSTKAHFNSLYADRFDTADNVMKSHRSVMFQEGFMSRLSKLLLPRSARFLEKYGFFSTEEDSVDTKDELFITASPVK